ncbi:MAG: quaternary ammonium compound-resistance protein SugE [Candidatus Methanomethylophilaceae archaeon]|nr:quaternary ammonium compound-resistance protein SugE [Candidatus Methanomethylophilaceae archaeon]
MELLTAVWLIVGGLLEPCWVIALKKSDSYRNRKWAVAAAILIVASPFFLSLAMLDMHMGTAYAIWTGIGAIGTMIAGYLLYQEKIDRLQIFFVFVIVAGITGLQYFGGA